MKNPMIKNTVILTVITLVSGLLLGLVYQVTKEPVALRAKETQEAAFAKVLPGADTFEEVELPKESGKYANDVEKAVIGKNSGGEIGMVFLVTNHEGYGGDISMAVGVSTDYSVTGLEILSLSETPGLGMRAKEPEFMAQYKGMEEDDFTLTGNSAQADVVTGATKAVSEKVDAISGATITSTAVNNGVHAALEYYRFLNQ